MPLKKRLTPTQRAASTLPDGWERALHHPVLKALTSYGQFPSDAVSVYDAYLRVVDETQPSMRDRVFVLFFSEVILRATSHDMLGKKAYLRSDRYLRDRELEIIDKAGLQYHAAFLWELPKLLKIKAGALDLTPYQPTKPFRKRLKTAPTARPATLHKRKRIKPKP